jgi:hypothetical protein
MATSEVIACFIGVFLGLVAAALLIAALGIAWLERRERRESAIRAAVDEENRSPDGPRFR